MHHGTLVSLCPDWPESSRCPCPLTLIRKVTTTAAKLGTRRVNSGCAGEPQFAAHTVLHRISVSHGVHSCKNVQTCRYDGLASANAP